MLIPSCFLIYIFPNFWVFLNRRISDFLIKFFLLLFLMRERNSETKIAFFDLLCYDPGLTVTWDMFAVDFSGPKILHLAPLWPQWTLTKQHWWKSMGWCVQLDKGSVDIKGSLHFHWNFKMLLKYLQNPADVMSLKAGMKSTRCGSLGFQTWSTDRASLTTAVPPNWALALSPVVCPCIVLLEPSSVVFPLTQ